MPHIPGHVRSSEELADIGRRARERLDAIGFQEPTPAPSAPPVFEIRPTPSTRTTGEPGLFDRFVREPLGQFVQGVGTGLRLGGPLGNAPSEVVGAFEAADELFFSVAAQNPQRILMGDPFSSFTFQEQQRQRETFQGIQDVATGDLSPRGFEEQLIQQQRTRTGTEQLVGGLISPTSLIPADLGIAAGARGLRGASTVADVVTTGSRALPPQLARRPTTAEAQRVISGIQRPGAIPADAVSITPPASSGNLFDFQPIQAGLSKAQELKNVARSTASRVTKKRIQPVEDNPLVSGALAERERVVPIIESQANRIGRSSEERVRRVFNFDENGRITELDGIDPRVRGAPTIQDVAARLPVYQEALGPERVSVLRGLEADVSQVKAVYDEVGIDISKRFDIEEGGFYLPRGSASTGDFDLPIVGTGRRGGTPGSNKPAVFSSQAEGINQGFEYPSFGDTLNQYVRESGNRARNRHVSDFFAKATDESGQLLGETAKQRVFRQNPDLIREFRGIQHDIARLKNLGFRMSGRLNSRVDDLINNPVIDDPEVLDSLISALDVRAARGLNAGQNIAEIRDSVRVMKGKLQKLRPAYKSALERARSSTRKQGLIDLPGLEGRAFPLEMANAANKVLEREGRVTGRGAQFVRNLEAIRDLYRGMRATLDNSAPGIQGLLGMVTKPRAFANALKTNVKVWFSRDSDKVLGKFVVDFDDDAIREGIVRPGQRLSDIMARNELRLGAGQTEFEIGRGTLSAIEKIPGVKRANRAFGFFGDTMRMDWAKDELVEQISKGRSLDEIISSGDLRRINRSVNRATGWTPGKFAGDIGDWLFFAPRFLQSRLETLASAGLGLRPGATLDQRIARKSMLRLISYAVTSTVLINEARGKETDFRPIVNGRFNSNFLRVRDFAGRDWSLLGTWDGIARAMITSGLGRPDQALRGLASGPVSMGWDLITGVSFNGERPLEDTVSFLTWLLRSFTPFAAEELPEAVGQISTGVQEGDPSQIASGAALITGEAFGAKSAPQSFLDEADSTAREMFQGQQYQDLEPYQKNDVQEQEAVERAGNRRPSYGYFPALDEIDQRQRDQHSSILHLVNLGVDNGGISPGEAVRKYFDAKTEARVSRDQAARNFNIEFDDTDPALAETPNEMALAQYYQTFDKATFDDVFVSRIWQEELEAVRAQWTSQQQAYVTRNINRRRLSQGIRDLLEDHSPNEFARQQASEDARNAHRRFVERVGVDPVPLSAGNFRFRGEGGAIEAVGDLISGNR